jgi:hypothetical protein
MAVGLVHIPHLQHDVVFHACLRQVSVSLAHFAPLSLNSYHSLTQQLLYNSIDHTFLRQKRDDLLPQDQLVVFIIIYDRLLLG